MKSPDLGRKIQDWEPCVILFYIVIVKESKINQRGRNDITHCKISWLTAVGPIHFNLFRSKNFTRV